MTICLIYIGYKTQSFYCDKAYWPGKDKLFHFVVFGSNGQQKWDKNYNKDVYQLYHRYTGKNHNYYFDPLDTSLLLALE